MVCDLLFWRGDIETKDREKKKVLDGITETKWITDKGRKEKSYANRRIIA